METGLVRSYVVLGSYKTGGEGRAGAEGPELVAGSDNARECR